MKKRKFSLMITIVIFLFVMGYGLLGSLQSTQPYGNVLLVICLLILGLVGGMIGYLLQNKII